MSSISITFLTFITYRKMGMNKCKMKLHGTTTIGPKGQIVIPKEVRDILKISPGDSVAIITKDDKAAAIIKNDNIQELLEFIKSEGIEIEN